MDYIKIMVEGEGEAYQEVQDGQVKSYRALDGTVLYDMIPTGVSSWVIDPNPTRLDWML